MGVLKLYRTYNKNRLIPQSSIILIIIINNQSVLEEKMNNKYLDE